MLNLKKDYMKKIFLINCSFWVIQFISLIGLQLLKFFHKFPTIDINNTSVSLSKILIINLMFYLLIILLGLISKYLSYGLFYYNAIIFTGATIIFLGTKPFSLYLIKILPHGILEILALSIATYIGINIKNFNYYNFMKKLFILGILLIIFSGLIEFFISSNI